jgi:glycosyltransferase A (GT-A) superfamily protein (DUF2064 family)
MISSWGLHPAVGVALLGQFAGDGVRARLQEAVRCAAPGLANVLTVGEEGSNVPQELLAVAALEDGTGDNSLWER